MSDGPFEERSCERCGASAPQDAWFCGACGSALSTPPVVAPRALDREEVRRRLRARRDVRDAAWNAFVPVLWFWLALLGILLGGGWLLGALDVAPPVADLVLSVTMAALVLTRVAADRERVAPSLAHSGFARDTWYLPLLAFAGLAGFMAAYFSVVGGWLGVPSVRYRDPFLDHGWPLWSVYVLVSLVPGVFEELAFRGVIQRRLVELVGARDAILLQATMFSVLHLSPLVFVSHAVMGLVFGWLAHRTRSLYPGMLLHVGWNAAVLWLE